MQIGNILSKHQLVPLFFAQDAVADSQTDVDLPTTDANNSVCLNVGYTMPFDGEIIAVSGNLDTAGSTGSLIIDATINTVQTTDPVVTITTDTALSDTCRRNTNPFDANDVIGASITTATWDGTTSDLQVTIWVLLKITGI